MKTITLFMLLTSTIFAAPSEPTPTLKNVEAVCNAYGAAIGRLFKEELLSKGVPKGTALWMKDCVNGYMQGVCIAAEGDFKSIPNSKITDATLYCIALAKKSK